MQNITFNNAFGSVSRAISDTRKKLEKLDGSWQKTKGLRDAVQSYKMQYANISPRLVFSTDSTPQILTYSESVYYNDVERIRELVTNSDFIGITTDYEDDSYISIDMRRTELPDEVTTRIVNQLESQKKWIELARELDQLANEINTILE